MYPYQIQGNRITIVVNNRPWTLAEGQVGYDDLRQAIRNKDWAAVPELVSPRSVVVSYTNGSNVSIVNDVLCYKGVELSDGISTRILSMREEGFDITPMVNFLERVMKNPSDSSRTELFQFLDKNDLPITEDGHFLAYKRVRHNYMDCHSNSIRNAVGDTPSMARTEVDDDRRNECSRGLHFCSFSYLRHFSGERTMILKIDPADVVSIPNDYDRAKGRCWRYEVVGEVADNASTDVLSQGPAVAKAVEPAKAYTDSNSTLRAELLALSQRKLYDLTVMVDPSYTVFKMRADGRIRNVAAAVDLLLEKFSDRVIREAMVGL